MNEFEEARDKMYEMAKTDPKVFNTILLQRLGNHILIILNSKAASNGLEPYAFLMSHGFGRDSWHITRNNMLCSISSILNVCSLLDINFIGIMGIIQSEINAYGVSKGPQSHA